jgi:hypothetical protein
MPLRLLPAMPEPSNLYANNLEERDDKILDGLPVFYLGRRIVAFPKIQSATESFLVVPVFLAGNLVLGFCLLFQNKTGKTLKSQSSNNLVGHDVWSGHGRDFPERIRALNS